MCGIAGIVNLRSTSALGVPITHMLRSMSKRGPDDEGYMLYGGGRVDVFKGKDSAAYDQQYAYIPTTHIDEGKSLLSEVAFGHRRLSIIDLSVSGHQPMCEVTEKFWITYNGEIYNYQEVKDKLVALGHAFRTNTDTEVVLNAYAEWGKEAVKEFNGMFSLAILDVSKQEIFFARDRIGIKPFYYTTDGTHFVFGSTMKSIIDSGLYSPEVDREGLWQNFSYSIAQRPRTVFKNISALEPGFSMVLDLKSKKYRKERYWDIPAGVQDFSLTENKAANLLEEALFHSIKYRLNSDVEVGSFMSGGVDSTVMAAMASKIQPNIKAFTLAFDGDPARNEVEEATATARMHEMDHIVSYVDANIVLKNIDAIVEGYEEPYFGLPANYSISKMVANHGVKVVLTGLGGDELFAGYDMYKKVNRWKKLRGLGAFMPLLPSGISSKVDKVKKLASINTIERYYAQYNTAFFDDQNARLFGDHYEGFTTIGDTYGRGLAFTDELEALSYYNLKSYIGNHQTRTIDQFTMHFSMEGRFPFLDHNLVELAFRIPSKYKIKGGVQKYVLKEVAKKYISPKSLDMEKKGFSLPVAHWIKNDLKSFVQEHVARLKTRNLFNNEEVDKILLSSSPNKIWQLVMVELWYAKFIDGN